MSENNKKRICIIGAGPSGLACLYSLSKKAKTMTDFPEVVCYEKQSDYGGLWNYSWKTGVDEFGEPCHGSMYTHLWTNAPKELLEFKDYTYKEHFGKSVPSYAPRAAVKEYIRKRFDQENVRRFIKFQFVVKRVVYHKEHDHFEVTVKDMVADKELEGNFFSHVFVASGHFSYPHIPIFQGMDTFNGRILHSHDYKLATQFVGKRLLVIGGSFSADDIAVQCIKFGAKHVICSWHKNPMNYVWPTGIEERPPVTKIDGSKVIFNDGTETEVDVIILCTGYNLHFPFLPDDLRLKSSNSLYPPDLYKGGILMKGGNNKIFFMGMQNQFYTFSMFECQAEFAISVALGEIQLPSREEMQKDSEKWLEKLQKDVTSLHAGVTFQTEYIEELCSIINKNHPWRPLAEIWYEWLRNRKENIGEFRNKAFKSVITGQDASVPVKKWIEITDDSVESYVEQKY